MDFVFVNMDPDASPLAPTLPCSGTAGITSAFSIATIRSMSSGRTPE